ncbi:TPA: hypothetical protein EYP44_00490, partial [Candidatus Bathyarchaeota archaeon]|nr:hypothetical protein [Candidatus Bathyarchaeota archaeon]
MVKLEGRCLAADLRARRGRVSLVGWVFRKRSEDGRVLMTIRDRSGLGELVIDGRLVRAGILDRIKRATPGSAVAMRGLLREGVFVPETVEILSPSEKMPIDVGSVDTSSLDLLRRRYLVLRSPRMMSVLKVQSELLMAIREFLQREGFVEIQPPIVGPVTDPGIRGADQVT